MQSGLYHHLIEVPGARGSIIVGTQDLVSRASAQPNGPAQLATELSQREFLRFTQLSMQSCLRMGLT